MDVQMTSSAECVINHLMYYATDVVEVSSPSYFYIVWGGLNKVDPGSLPPGTILDYQPVYIDEGL